MPGNVAPDAKQYFTDLDGNPLAAGQIFHFLAGTSSPPEPVYTDSDLLVPHPHPIILPADGKVTIFYDAKSYKIRVEDEFGALMEETDNVSGAGGGGGGAGSGTSVRPLPLYGDHGESRNEVAYPAGIGLDSMVPGTRIQALDSADLVGSDWGFRCTAAVTSGSCSVGLFNLTDAPTVPLVELTIASAVGAGDTSIAIVWPGAGVTKNYGVKVKTDGVEHARVWGCEIVPIPSV